MNKNVLITGGLGFIGMNFVEMVLKTDNVVVIDMIPLTEDKERDFDLKISYLKDLAEKNNTTFRFIFLDLSNIDNISRKINGYFNENGSFDTFDVCYHFASNTKVIDDRGDLSYFENLSMSNFLTKIISFLDIKNLVFLA